MNFKKAHSLIFAYLLMFQTINEVNAQGLNIPPNMSEQEKDSVLVKLLSDRNSYLNFSEIARTNLPKIKNSQLREEATKGWARKLSQNIGGYSPVNSLDYMGYFFLSYLEKDFYRYPNLKEFYLAFHHLFRGPKADAFRSKCVYRRTNSRPFSLLTYIKAGDYGCTAIVPGPHIQPGKMFAELDRLLGEAEKRIPKVRESLSLMKKLGEENTSVVEMVLEKFISRANAGKGLGLKTGFGLFAAAVALIAVGSGLTSIPTGVTQGFGIPMIVVGAVILAVMLFAAVDSATPLSDEGEK
jgi:hypothetical protein